MGVFTCTDIRLHFQKIYFFFPFFSDKKIYTFREPRWFSWKLLFILFRQEDYLYIDLDFREYLISARRMSIFSQFSDTLDNFNLIVDHF